MLRPQNGHVNIAAPPDLIWKGTVKMVWRVDIAHASWLHHHGMGSRGPIADRRRKPRVRTPLSRAGPPWREPWSAGR